MSMQYSKVFLSGLYRQLYTIRVFETRCIQLYRQGLIRGYLHPYLGEEAIAVGVCAALGPQDYVTSTHRGHGHCIARGADLRRMTAEITGKRTGYCRGRGGSMHIADVSKGTQLKHTFIDAFVEYHIAKKEYEPLKPLGAQFERMTVDIIENIRKFGGEGHAEDFKSHLEDSKP